MKNSIEVRRNGSYKGVFAKIPIQKGETILTLEGQIKDKPSRYSLQLDHVLHLDVPESGQADIDEYYPWKFLNHSCDPNAYMDVKNRKLIALKDILSQTEIGFNYNTTEYELAEPFECSCNDRKVMVRGYKYLSPEEKELLSPYVASHLSV